MDARRCTSGRSLRPAPCAESNPPEGPRAGCPRTGGHGRHSLPLTGRPLRRGVALPLPVPRLRLVPSPCPPGPPLPRSRLPPPPAVGRLLRPLPPCPPPPTLVRRKSMHSPRRLARTSTALSSIESSKKGSALSSSACPSRSGSTDSPIAPEHKGRVRGRGRVRGKGADERGEKNELDRARPFATGAKFRAEQQSRSEKGRLEHREGLNRSGVSTLFPRTPSAAGRRTRKAKTRVEKLRRDRPERQIRRVRRTTQTPHWERAAAAQPFWRRSVPSRSLRAVPRPLPPPPSLLAPAPPAPPGGATGASARAPSRHPHRLLAPLSPSPPHPHPVPLRATSRAIWGLARSHTVAASRKEGAIAMPRRVSAILADSITPSRHPDPSRTASFPSSPRPPSAPFARRARASTRAGEILVRPASIAMESELLPHFGAISAALHGAVLALAVLPLFVGVPVGPNIVVTAAATVFVGCWRSVKPEPPAESMTRKVRGVAFESSVEVDAFGAAQAPRRIGGPRHCLGSSAVEGRDDRTGDGRGGDRRPDRGAEAGLPDCGGGGGDMSRDASATAPLLTMRVETRSRAAVSRCGAPAALLCWNAR